MDSWKPIAPIKSISQPQSQSQSQLQPHSHGFRLTSVLKPIKQTGPADTAVGPLVGRWPESILLRIVQFLPIPDLPNVARSNRALARIVRDEKTWELRCRALGVSLFAPTNQSSSTTSLAIEKSRNDDDFGEFSQGHDMFEDVDFGDMNGTVDKIENLLDLNNVPLPSRPGKRTSGFFAIAPVSISPGPWYLAYKAKHVALLPLCLHLRSSPSPSAILALLFPPSPTTALPPSLSEQSELLLTLLLFLSPLLQPLRDWGFLRQALLSAADRFDSTCLVAFEVADSKKDLEGMRIAADASWKVYEAGGGRRDEWECGRVWIERREVFYDKWDGTENIVKIQGTKKLDFTPMDAFMTHVLESFRIDAEMAIQIFPATSKVILSFCDRVSMDVIGEYIQALLSQTRIISPDLLLRATPATFVQAWKLVDVTMDILRDSSARPEIEGVIYRMFEVNMDEYLEEETDAVRIALDNICKGWDKASSASTTPTFLTASNPDQVKRNVLAGFRDVLLLPVTIVPRTVTYGVNAIVGTGRSGAVTPIPTPDQLSTPQISAPATTSNAEGSFDKLQLLVSLDTALELIQGDRESLKRSETFAKYPGKYGVKVRETIEEIFILLLKAVGDRHIAPGFRTATLQMSTYKPAEHEETSSVAPLLQFFELVHVGDTIQSMVQVYFDKELAQYVDKNDFLNPVMREKKRFESVLDDAVAAGLNAGIEVLMNQVEHIILVKTGPREYYPEGTLDLGPTQGCREAIACLEVHCNLLRGSTSKEVLEVFYQEVGIRLQAILQRHLKRQIISLEGGFQIIADLNAYHAFVASLKQQRITDDFSNLKMLGHVYIVSDAKDLAQIVRDVTRYGGTFTPEDIYEFIQRRSDWKKIEKTVDKAMYALSVKEDCVVM